VEAVEGIDSTEALRGKMIVRSHRVLKAAKLFSFLATPYRVRAYLRNDDYITMPATADGRYNYRRNYELTSERDSFISSTPASSSLLSSSSSSFSHGRLEIALSAYGILKTHLNGDKECLIPRSKFCIFVIIFFFLFFSLSLGIPSRYY